MCGIFGTISDGSDSLQRKLMCVANTTRGQRGSMDGTGLVWRGRKKGWSTAKNKKAGLAFIADGDANEAWSSPVLLGHVRGVSAALGTGGGISDENSHPFKHGKVTLCHNGMFRNWHEHKPAASEGGRKFQVDSDLLAYLVATEGHQAFAKVEGPVACWWVEDGNDGEFFMYCHKQDLFTWEATSKKSATRYAFSSEKAFLEAAGFTAKSGRLMEIDPTGQLWKVDVKSGEAELLDVIAGKAPTVTTTPYHLGFGGRDDNVVSLPTRHTTAPAPLPSKKIDASELSTFPSLTSGYSEGDAVAIESASQWWLGVVIKGAGASGHVAVDVRFGAHAPTRLYLSADSDRIRWIPKYKLTAFLKEEAKTTAQKRVEDDSMRNAPFPPYVIPSLLNSEQGKIPRCPECLRVTFTGACPYCKCLNVDFVHGGIMRPDKLGVCYECGALYAWTSEEYDGIAKSGPSAITCPDCSEQMFSGELATFDVADKDMAMYACLSAFAVSTGAENADNNWVRRVRESLRGAENLDLFNDNLVCMFGAETKEAACCSL